MAPLVSADGGKTWAQGSAAYALDWVDIECSADCSVMAAPAAFDFVYISTDLGQTWTSTGQSGAWSSLALSGSGSTIVAGQAMSQVSYSLDGGASWGISGDASPWTNLEYVEATNTLVAPNLGASPLVYARFGPFAPPSPQPSAAPTPEPVPSAEPSPAPSTHTPTLSSADPDSPPATDN